VKPTSSKVRPARAMLGMVVPARHKLAIGFFRLMGSLLATADLLDRQLEGRFKTCLTLTARVSRYGAENRE